MGKTQLKYVYTTTNEKAYLNRCDCWRGRRGCDSGGNWEESGCLVPPGRCGAATKNRKRKEGGQSWGESGGLGWGRAVCGVGTGEIRRGSRESERKNHKIRVYIYIKRVMGGMDHHSNPLDPSPVLQIG